MKKQLHSLNNLKAFEAVGRYGNLQDAADELCVTQSAVSRLVTALEERLNTQLFSRKNKRMTLTSDGETLFKASTYAFGIIKNALYDLSISEKNALTVSCEPTIAMKWLIPRLMDFRKNYPAINIHIYAAGGAVDFSENQIDLAIRRNDFPIPQTLFAEFLADEWIAPVVHSSVDIKHIANVSKLHTQTRLNAWSKWEELNDMEKESLTFSNELWFEHFYLSLQAASSKLGAGIASLYMVHDDLLHENLKPLFPFIKDGTQYVLLAKTPIDEDENKRIFRDWLKLKFQEDLSILEQKTEEIHRNHIEI